MTPQFRPPLITGKTTREQIDQIIAYLRQLSVTLSRMAESGQLTEQDKTHNV